MLHKIVSQKKQGKMNHPPFLVKIAALANIVKNISTTSTPSLTPICLERAAKKKAAVLIDKIVPPQRCEWNNFGIQVSYTPILETWTWPGRYYR
jgi:hypothetical protein